VGRIAVTFFVALAAGAAPGTHVVLPRANVSFVLPPGWHVTTARLNAVVDPVTIFTATSFPFRQARPDQDGICAPTLRSHFRATGAYVQLTEERDGASRKRMLRRVAPRPRHFLLNARGGGGLCTPADSGEIVFHERGRAFYLFYGIGRRASPATRAALTRLVDSLEITARRRL
jgi:hypothetical protein